MANGSSIEFLSATAPLGAGFGQSRSPGIARPEWQREDCRGGISTSIHALAERRRNSKLLPEQALTFRLFFLAWRVREETRRTRRPALLEITCFELGTPAIQTMPNPGLTKPRIYEKLSQGWTDK